MRTNGLSAINVEIQQRLTLSRRHTDRDAGGRMRGDSIVVMAGDNNLRGDLFSRLMCDLFHALGYEDFRLDVNRTGREIDIKGRHRTEPRELIAECKATNRPISGSDVNKFAGAAQVETARTNLPITSYFVSLSGFTAPALEQEIEAGNRVTLLTGTGIASELVRGRVIVSKERAISAARGAVRNLPVGVSMTDRALIIAHQIGWLWAFFFAKDGEETHYTIIHADGHGLADNLARQVQLTDDSCTEIFTGLTYLSSVAEELPSQQEGESLKYYFNYLLREFGAITLEGLPVDREVGSRRFDLESLYVPQHLQQSTGVDIAGGIDTETRDQSPSKMRPWASYNLPASRILQGRKHVAVLAPPGSGKTTLLKRLATAYADPERQREVDDHLPHWELFPLFLRCRQLGKRAREPIVKTLSSLIEQAEHPELKEPFGELVRSKLKSGDALVLIDGLDEINDESDRIAFCTQLRTFIGTYPTVHVITTSREAGFRAVAGAVAPVCDLYRIADLSDHDILRLCNSWQREVVGGTSEESARLANDIYKSIVQNPRVRELAINPLLLTTLLLVQRWLGEIPTKRSVLYGKAIEVLLMTWNTAGHDPIDPEEATPQLAFAAFSMMTLKRQAVSAKELRDMFNRARREMPEILSFARVSSASFIERVEERSSLVIRSGSIIEDGQLRPLYEFNHLTFQEYLTALAAVESWHPDRDQCDDILALLEPYLNDASWTEVVPLATVMGGIRHAKEIVRRIVDLLKETDPESGTGGVASGDGYDDIWESPLYMNLRSCLGDGAPIPPALASEALDVLITHSDEGDGVVDGILTSRFSEMLTEVAWEGYRRFEGDYVKYATVLAELTDRVKYREDAPLSIIRDLEGTDERTRAMAAFGAMQLCYRAYPNAKHSQADADPRVLARNRRHARTLKPHLVLHFKQSIAREEMFASTWALCWAIQCCSWTRDEVNDLLIALVERFFEVQDVPTEEFLLWAVDQLPVQGVRFDRDEFTATPELIAFVDRVNTLEVDTETIESKRAAIKMAYFARDFFTDEEVLSAIDRLADGGLTDDSWFESLRNAIHRPSLF
ncbi:NACHT domain-containing protein [Streptomyces antibioticus]|uniref:NACHT domain-containing protein n=1 Tax=Streptomyces antibioticus TaxID=1890 RepID=UPI0036D89045